ncbi:UPF0348 protein YlbM [Pullulanibacillus camelliae]|uniref:tRNA(Met) cytidine acetate ligase n=1 Tax=Pullulanibacillus camelliae TaxID=1707096 RepID=A0A8J2VVB5_9BACL|nr:nucleotidyltransferase [Pullulanibacillus camelliae]GGE41199.1 UPF0348 protein YlbM [Pullulanibacillus camelliae]
MNIAGVIVEYNPFHNGHHYHLEATRKQTEADLVVAVMSGPFLQRGEPALLSKWERTKLALQAGIDIVIELPYPYATQRAEVFAWGAVSLLHAIGTTHLCFGSEAGTIEPFLKTIEHFAFRKEDYNTLLKKYMAEGNSYPKATALAYKALGLIEEGLLDLSKPNNILGYHYVQAVQKLQSPLRVETIKRVQAGYHDADITDAHIASATAIRKALFEYSKEAPSLKQLTPWFTAAALEQAQQFKQLRRWEDYFSYLKYRLLTEPKEKLNSYYEAEEGLENRFSHVIQHAHSFSDFMTAVKTKRYTWTRIQRLCTHMLTGTTKAEMEAANQLAFPQYLRLLGMSQQGQRYLNQCKKQLSIPLVTKISDIDSQDLIVDHRAAECYQLVDQNNGEIPREYQRTPIRYDAEKKCFI